MRRSRFTACQISGVGGGVAGVTAAYLLQQAHEVTLFEKNASVGGHTRTWVLQGGPDAGEPVAEAPRTVRMTARGLVDAYA